MSIEREGEALRQVKAPRVCTPSSESRLVRSHSRGHPSRCYYINHNDMPAHERFICSNRSEGCFWEGTYTENQQLCQENNYLEAQLLEQQAKNAFAKAAAQRSEEKRRGLEEKRQRQLRMLETREQFLPSAGSSQGAAITMSTSQKTVVPSSGVVGREPTSRSA
ncbi:hypothetical protein BT69DRAFT_590851 [Atractiella rhizophila]|nr:hypothetical protein BT69DRAFT_590851 [Atractiella rhizophila]